MQHEPNCGTCRHSIHSVETVERGFVVLLFCNINNEVAKAPCEKYSYEPGTAEQKEG